jgi:hypothetical protein
MVHEPLRMMLETIAELSRTHPVAVLLRHSTRHEILDARSALEARLTTEGKALARDFGALLPVDRTVRIFHSPVERCRETAAAIEEGFREKGGRVSLVKRSGALGGPYIVDPGALLDMLATMDPRAFMEAWAEGRVDETVIRPLRASAVEALRGILSALGEGGAIALDFHVTHDINVLIALSLAQDHASVSTVWPDYLEGLIVHPEDGGIVLIFRQRRCVLGMDVLERPAAGDSFSGG